MRELDNQRKKMIEMPVTSHAFSDRLAGAPLGSVLVEDVGAGRVEGVVICYAQAGWNVVVMAGTGRRLFGFVRRVTLILRKER